MSFHDLRVSWRLQEQMTEGTSNYSGETLAEGISKKGRQECLTYRTQVS